MLFPTSLVGSYPQPDWLIDRARLAGRFPPRVRARELWRVGPGYLAAAPAGAAPLAVTGQEPAGGGAALALPPLPLANLPAPGRAARRGPAARPVPAARTRPRAVAGRSRLSGGGPGRRDPAGHQGSGAGRPGHPHRRRGAPGE